jgi:hypothetical protein
LTSIAPPRGRRYHGGMKDPHHLSQLRIMRDQALGLLAPLEAGKLLSGDAAANSARINSLRNLVRELDAMIAFEEGRNA